jgi:hypothetical protein
MEVSVDPFYDFNVLVGRIVIDPEGEEIGRIEAVYEEGDAQRFSWALVDAGSRGRHLAFFPDGHAFVEEDVVHIPFSASHVYAAPEPEAAGEVPSNLGERAVEHFSAGVAPPGPPVGPPRPRGGSSSGGPSGGAGQGGPGVG